MKLSKILFSLTFCFHVLGTTQADAPFGISGIYPHLASFNEHGECGTGAVVPWAGKLWIVTYGPHYPQGSTDKLYSISPDLEMEIFPGSIGGTPANRMIHEESNQLFIGPYAIDGEGNVRVIPYAEMPGRHTGNARHLTDPENKIYYGTMEEGFYEVDVHNLEVTELYADLLYSERRTRGTEWNYTAPLAGLLGAHGKGLYSGQGRLIYSNNGERGSSEYFYNPFMTSGSLASWDGNEWETVMRAQFTEVTGPGGIYGNPNPETDPVWAVGWDAKSLLLMVLDDGEWHRYRLGKGSHSYDGAHGWNTEWPRIREIGEDYLLMTMHGMFWEFPITFAADNIAGIKPLSKYLKVIGDYARWGDKVVFGTDDTARSEFLNTRAVKGEIASPQSQSNLWFVDPEKLDHIGPAAASGAVWLDEDVIEDEKSDRMHVQGFDRRGIHLSNAGRMDGELRIMVGLRGNDWRELDTVELAANSYQWYALPDDPDIGWVQLVAEDMLFNVSAWFEMSENDEREPYTMPKMFDGVATVDDENAVGGLVHAMSNNARKLQFAVDAGDGEGSESVGYYHLDAEMNLKKVHAPGAYEWMQEHVAIPERRNRVFRITGHSVIYTHPSRQRYRFPKTLEGYDAEGPLGWGRIAREIATERDLFHAHGTFYELPAENAGGFNRVRPVASHNLRIKDYCSYRGLFVMSGVDIDEETDNPHIIRSGDGKAGLWVGAVDDLWTLGKPVGVGGPWYKEDVGAGEASDAYLMRGYDEKTLELTSSDPTVIIVQVDITGTGDWKNYKDIELTVGNLEQEYRFPTGFQAYWVRFISSQSATITTTLTYQ